MISRYGLKAPTAEEESAAPSTKPLTANEYLQLLAGTFGEVARDTAELVRRARQAEERNAIVRVTAADFATMRAIPPGDWKYIIVNRPGVGEANLTTLQPFRLQLDNRYYQLPSIGPTIVPYFGEATFGITLDPISGSTKPTGNWSIEILLTNRNIGGVSNSLLATVGITGDLKIEGVGIPGAPSGGLLTVQGGGSGQSIGIGASYSPMPYDLGNVISQASLNSIVGNNALATAPIFWNGLSGVQVRTPLIFKSTVVTTAGNTTVWTPTAGKKFRLMRFAIVLTDEATRAVAGDITIKFQDVATDVGIGFPIYVPAAAIAAPIGEAWNSGWIDLGNGYLSALANNVLNVNLSAALTAGMFGVMVAGTEE